MTLQVLVWYISNRLSVNKLQAEILSHHNPQTRLAGRKDVLS